MNETLANRKFVFAPFVHGYVQTELRNLRDSSVDLSLWLPPLLGDRPGDCGQTFDERRC